MSDGGFCHYCQKSNCICKAPNPIPEDTPFHEEWPFWNFACTSRELAERLARALDNLTRETDDRDTDRIKGLLLTIEARMVMLQTEVEATLTEARNLLERRLK